MTAATDAPRPRAALRAKTVAALLLTLASGIVDLVGYLGIYRVFTAHMTGTTVHIAQRIAEGRWAQAAIAAVVVPAFVLGSILGRCVIELWGRRRARGAASVTLGLEAGMVTLAAGLAATYPGTRDIPLVPAGALVAVFAAAMGLQTATLTRIGPLTVHTTFVTGMLNKMAQLLSHRLFRAYDRARGRGALEGQGSRSGGADRPGFLALIWVSYLLGAVAGALGHDVWGMRAAYGAVGLLVVVIVVDQVWDLAVAEEKEQLER